MAKPYANSTAKPDKAIARIRTMLLKFGVKSLSWKEDIENHVVALEFVYKEYRLNVPIDYGKLAKVYIEDAPLTYRSRKTAKQYEAEKLEIASRAAYSLLEDYFKGTLMRIELDTISFEEAFINSFVDKQGRRLGTILVPQLKEYTSGQLMLERGE